MTRPLSGDEPLDQRTQIMMSKSELAAIDDWMFTHRVRSRSEAIRQLIARGLAAPDEAPATAPEKKRKPRPGT